MMTTPPCGFVLLNFCDSAIDLRDVHGCTTHMQPHPDGPARIVAGHHTTLVTVSTTTSTYELVRKTPKTEGLPPAQEGVLLVVSRRMAEALPLRRDLVAVTGKHWTGSGYEARGLRHV